MSAIALSVELVLIPSEMERFLARVREHRNNVLAKEPGCQRFDILVPDEGENTVLLHEVYDDEAALQVHFDSPYMKAYMTDTGPMIARRHRRRCSVGND